jgi:hypothetical protein
MTAWTDLIAGSTIEGGTAWEHLQAQGGGTGTYIILANGLEAEMAGIEIEAELTADIEADIDQAGVAAELIAEVEGEI